MPPSRKSVGAIFNGRNRADTYDGTPDDDRFSGNGGNDTLSGKRGNDVIEGGSGKDRIKGDQGNDQIDGGRGNDRLFGDAGDDFIDGGTGNDRMTGGSGADIFALSIGKDRIEDFEIGADKVDLRGLDLTLEEVATALANASVVKKRLEIDFGDGRFFSSRGSILAIFRTSILSCPTRSPKFQAAQSATRAKMRGAQSLANSPPPLRTVRRQVSRPSIPLI